MAKTKSGKKKCKNIRQVYYFWSTEVPKTANNSRLKLYSVGIISFLCLLWLYQLKVPFNQKNVLNNRLNIVRKSLLKSLFNQYSEKSIRGMDFVRKCQTNSSIYKKWKRHQIYTVRNESFLFKIEIIEILYKIWMFPKQKQYNFDPKRKFVEFDVDSTHDSFNHFNEYTSMAG